LVSKQLTYAQGNQNAQLGNKDRKGTSDSIVVKADTVNYKIASSDLKSAVKYEAIDSIVYDAESKMFYLYNNGKIAYDDLNLTASEIQFNTDSNLLMAYHVGAITDTTEMPIFTQGEQLFNFDTLQYNFKSQRALVQEAHTKYGEGFITSERVKRNADQSIYGIKSIYSTCELDTPHFGIYANKIKVIPNVVGISGPARLYIESIPTPIVLPFAIYPLTKGQKAGFILPQYGFEFNRGFGLRSGGYYFPINDYVDLKILGDIYTYGSWRFGGVSTYTKKYNYSGSVEVSISDNKLESEQFSRNAANRTFSVNWQHRIDPKKLNNANFSASVRVTSSNNNKFNFNQNINNFLENKYGSSITYSKTWPGKPYNLTISANHNQDNNTRRFEIRLPEVQFSANGITPFARKIIIGKQRWYEKINVNYSARGVNTLEFYDTAFSIARLKLNDFKNGLQHTLSSSYNTTVLKYFNFGVTANYNEYWYSKRQRREYDDVINRIDTTITNNFFAARDYGFSSSLTTTIYGTKMFKRGKIRGIRHTMIPSIDFRYNPDFSKSPFNSYYTTFLDTTGISRNLSYYEGSIIGRPGSGRNGSIGFNLRNTVAAKILNIKDTANSIKKISILDNFGISTSYNLAADSFQLAPLSYNWSTSLLGGKLNLRGSGSWSWYGWDYENRRESKELAWQRHGKVMRFQGSEIVMSTSLQSLKNQGAVASTADQQRSFGFDQYNYYDFNIPWDVRLDATLRATRGLTKDGLRDTINYLPTARIDGNITLTENWKLGARTGFDVINKRINDSQITLSRDLHCWEMSIGFVPFGSARGYNFTLAPKSGMLHDLRVTRNKSFWDYR
jgi:hypothetical protein